MKKFIVSLLIGVVLFSAVGYGVAMAQDQKLNDCCKIGQSFTLEGVQYTKGDLVGSKSGGTSCSLGTVPVANQIDNWGLVCMMGTVYTITNWIFFIMTILAVLMIVFGGLTYITAAGDPAKAGKGKVILTYAIIGLAIALIAKLVPSLVRFILGM